MSTITFTPHADHLNIVVEFDTGWNEENQCGGKGRNEFTILPNDLGVAIITYRAMGNHSDELKVVYCRGSVYFSKGGSGPSIFNTAWSLDNVSVDVSGRTTKIVETGTTQVRQHA